ncbi:DUF4062 domain-containing protein [Lentzea sp. CC55]|uniref:DUF4062 domain-containing protein n=1 Tax=Lentzea sp. CC55 TaxID=2884909 RepID=UPI001F3EE065|nr:DUF4062 domain-containing protein [Lentzea sp. CC55]MCG8926146.1 DUF4062 domain-containing protein [Lentzea sp. CC55]
MVLPISWSEHAAAEFGQPPQAILNRQIVDSCDGCIAIFANRMGTPTAVAASGTAEEIHRLAESGKYVGILRCRRDVKPGTIDHIQAARLDDYLNSITGQALILSYSSDAELARHVNNILVQAVSRDQARADLQRQEDTAPPAPIAEVWPRIESYERQIGNRSTRDWRLVLHNTGSAPANNVYFSLDDENTWHVMRNSENPDEPDVEILAPGGEAKFHMAVTFASASRALCTVQWDDSRGRQQNSATLLIG